MRWGRRERWGRDPLARSPAAVVGIPGHIEERNRSEDLEVVGYRWKSRQLEWQYAEV